MLDVGSKIGRYVVERVVRARIGRTHYQVRLDGPLGFGRFYEVITLGDVEDAKVDLESVAELLRQWAGISSTRLVDIFEMGAHATEGPYIVIEHIPGPTLAELLERARTSAMRGLPVAVAAHLAAEVATIVSMTMPRCHSLVLPELSADEFHISIEGWMKVALLPATSPHMCFLERAQCADMCRIGRLLRTVFERAQGTTRMERALLAKVATFVHRAEQHEHSKRQDLGQILRGMLFAELPGFTGGEIPELIGTLFPELVQASDALVARVRSRPLRLDTSHTREMS